MEIRFVNSKVISDTVRKLCLEANTVLRKDVLDGIKDLYAAENNKAAKNMLEILIRNAEIAREAPLAICQDTGKVAVFIEIGNRVMVEGENIIRAVNAGIEEAYKEGYFRKSVVRDPLLRDNTGTNTPGVIHLEAADGDRIKISVMPKGFGSENKGRLAMMNPTAGKEKIVEFCVDTVKKAGPDACPPYILGIGIGGTMEECAILAKRALLRPINEFNPKKHVKALELEIMKKANDLKIGIMGLGGISTVLGVNIEVGSTHIAGLPVAVNVSCHALRSATAVI